MNINVDTLVGDKRDFLDITLNEKEYRVTGISIGTLLEYHDKDYSPKKLRDSMVKILKAKEEEINEVDDRVLTAAFGVILKWHYGMSEAEILAEDQKDSENP